MEIISIMAFFSMRSAGLIDRLYYKRCCGLAWLRAPGLLAGYAPRHERILPHCPRGRDSNLNPVDSPTFTKLD
jgi:hypothetical protein